MKKFMLQLCAFGCGTILVVGCSTMAQTYGSVPIEYPEMAAELDVNTDSKLIATNSTTYLFGLLKISGGSKYAEYPGTMGSLFGRPGNLSRASATYKAVENYDYDVVVAPTYRTTKTIGFLHLWVTYKTTMTGYGAKIKSLRLTDGQEAGATSVQYTDTSEDIVAAKAAKKSGNVQKPNPIFQEKNLEMFENGTVLAANKNDQKNLLSDFIEEIESNLSKAKTEEEFEFIRRKVNALNSFNESLEKPNRTTKKAVEDFEQSIEKGLARLSNKGKSIFQRLTGNSSAK